MSKPKRKPGRPSKPIPKLAETPEQIAKAIFRAADRKSGPPKPDGKLVAG